MDGVTPKHPSWNMAKSRTSELWVDPDLTQSGRGQHRPLKYRRLCMVCARVFRATAGARCPWCGMQPPPIPSTIMAPTVSLERAYKAECHRGRQYAAGRGHDMAPFTRDALTGLTGVAKCRTCGGWIRVSAQRGTRIAPVFGTALAKTCWELSHEKRETSTRR